MKKKLIGGVKSKSLKKKLIMVLGIIFLFSLSSLQTFASGEKKETIHRFGDQQKTITGKVVNSDGEPIPGVTVVVKGTNNGTVTNSEGSYSLSNVPEESVLVFSSIGFERQEKNVTGITNVDVTLVASNEQLDEIVVTALGIERERKSLGYATAQVTSEELTVNRTPNFMNSLTGKIAGVDISAMGTGPAGTSKIRIRGQSSIAGQNNPLIVVNGVPIDNTNFGAKPNSVGSDNSIGTRGGGMVTDGGDGLISINPDDVESMTVLKGAAASALYGSRAKDGVIMITTKKKGTQEGIGVSYNLNYTNNMPLDYTDFQYEYGQGEHGARPTSPFPTSGQWSFGEKFEPGMTQVLFNNLTVPYEPQYDRIDKFYRHGQSITNTVTLSTNNVNGGMHLSYANMNNKGIVPNNTFEKNSINLGFTYSLTDKLSFQGAVNYSNEKNENPPNIANQDNSIPTVLMMTANSMPLDVLRDNRYDSEGNEAIWSRFRNRTNPYFTLYEQFQNIVRDRIFGNITVRYDLFDWLFVQGRYGQDYWSRDQDYNNYPTGQASRAPAPEGFVNGLYTQEVRRFRETNADFLISATKDFGDFGINIQAGGNQMYKEFRNNSVQATDFIVRGLYTVENARSTAPQYNLSERAVNSLYGAAELSYNDLLFLNGTVRNDWFSTLSPENRSILYPSISASYIFSQSFSNQPDWLTFGKLRAAYAEVGSDTDVSPYSDVLFYGVNSNLFPNPAGNLQPLGGSSGNTVPNPNLRPMRTKEAELGLEMRMFQNRVGFEVSVYKKLTIDQIVAAQISTASGFDDTRINSGESESKGIELMVNLVPVNSTNFNWDFIFTGAYNTTEVLSLLTDEPGENITVGTSLFNGSLTQVVGKELGQVTGFGYKRDANGQIVHNANGIPIRTDDLMYFGSALPKWTGGFTNTFRYKNLTFSFLIDFKLGGIMNSGTNFNLVRHGLHKMTLEGREGKVGPGVNEAGGPNTVAADIQTYWEVIRSQSLIEPIIYDSGYWKLRQLTLGYDFSGLLPPASFVKGLTFNLTAYNVLMIKKWVPNIDPDSFGYTSDNLVGLESTGLPTTRDLGFNFNVKF